MKTVYDFIFHRSIQTQTDTDDGTLSEANSVSMSKSGLRITANAMLRPLITLKERRKNKNVVVKDTAKDLDQVATDRYTRYFVFQCKDRLLNSKIQMETLETLLNPKKSQLLVILREEHVLICGR